MFGAEIDYKLLRALTHSRNLKTREQQREEARNPRFTMADADAYLERCRTEFFPDRFPLDPSLSYLDVGCGMGRLSLALGRAGMPDVTAVDIVPHNIEQATRLAEQLPQEQRPDFSCIDIHDWKTERRFDVVIVLGAMEHIHDQDRFLRALAGLLAPGGRALVSIEPFHSPFGDHLQHVFKVPMPWAGLVFSEAAMMRIRTERFRPSDPVERYADVEGGLNQVRYERYLQNVRDAGLAFERNNINPQLRKRRRLLPARVASRVLTAAPGIRDYFIVTDYGVLRHAADVDEPAR